MRPAEGLARVLELVTDASPPATVLIDGPSGSGKSTFADALLLRWPVAQLVRLDAVYPGWSGLDAASSAVVRDILAPRAAGAGGRWRRWDWAAEAPAEWHELDAALPVIIEGCGSLSRRAVSSVGLRSGVEGRTGGIGVWVVAPDRFRRSRALARDDGAFDEHWDMWEEQWRRYQRREQPDRAASVVIEVDEAQPPAGGHGER